MNTQNISSEDQLLTFKEAAQRLIMCPRSLQRHVASKKFPPPIKLRGKSVYFLSDVTSYLARMKAQRDSTFTVE